MAKRAKVCRPIPHARGEIVLIEYDHDDLPIVVVTRGKKGLREWRVIPSKRDGCRYLVGPDGGNRRGTVELHAWAELTPTTAVWCADGVTLDRWSHEGAVRDQYGNRDSIYAEVRTRADFARLGKRRIPAPLALDPFEDTDELDSEDQLVYCGICGDDMRDDLSNLCDHLFDSDNGLTGPGNDPLRKVEDIPEGLKTLVRRGGFARHLLSRLSRGECLRWACGDVMIPRRAGDFRRVDIDDLMEENGGIWDNAMRVGAGWLRALDADTTHDNAIIAAWLREEIAAQDARRASGEAVYAVRSGWLWGEVLRAKRRPYAEARAIAARLRAKGERDVRIVRQVPKAQRAE